MSTYALIYEINTRVWLNELKKQYSPELNLSSVPIEEWQWFKKLGFSYIWLMGIWQASPYSREISFNTQYLYEEYNRVLPDLNPEDVGSSPYAIFNYEIDPNLGTRDDLLKLKSALNGLNIGLILDFVPNHTAADHPWTHSHPEYYIQGTETDNHQNPSDYIAIDHHDQKFYIAHGKDPHFPCWSDTAQLNYFNPQTREALITTLQSIAEVSDGVRCDMAMLCLNDVHGGIWQPNLSNFNFQKLDREFWDQAIQQVKLDLPNFIFMAESYWDKEKTLLNLGFDFVYDKKLYDFLQSADTSNLTSYLANQPLPDKWLRFIENHDEDRATNKFSGGKGKASAVAYLTLPGLKLIHQGQIEGNTIKLPVQLLRSPHEKPNDDIVNFYQLLLMTLTNQVFSQGNWFIINNSYPGLLSWAWQHESETTLILINYSDHIITGDFPLMEINWTKSNYQVQNLFNNQSDSTEPQDVLNEGYKFNLKPYQWLIVKIY